MKLTQITITYGETQSLPEYSNVKPAITLAATLDQDDDPAEVEALLWQHAKESVHSQVDLALEANGRPAKYSAEPRYQVMQTYWNEWDHRGETKPPQYVVILPNEINIERGAYAQRLIAAGNVSDSRKLRYEHARRVADEIVREEQRTLLDCSNGDLTPLLALGAPQVDPEVALDSDNPF